MMLEDAGMERKIVVLARVARAKADLNVRDPRRRLRDVEVSLAEDHRTVIVYANWDDDTATICSSFMLPQPVAAEDFDAGYFRRLFES
jgi:hypothetical protein